jgi:hypothetical protein
MAIKRYFAEQDTTITNAYASNLRIRGTGSNMGASDVLETFSIYGQQNSSSVEKSRILLQFPLTEVSSDRTAGNLPASGSVKFYLRLFNAEHPFTLPTNFTMSVHAVSSSWREGLGLDMEEYSDSDFCNWVASSYSDSAATEVAWTSQGGDYHITGPYDKDTANGNMPFYQTLFKDGTEDLELNVTAMVEEWLSGRQSNYGFGIFLSSSFEDGSKARSYYTKKFFGRGTEFFFKRPTIEARWDSSKKDNRGNFYFSSSLASQANNLNTIYLYNYVRGQLQNIPDVGTGPIFVTIFSGNMANNAAGTSSIKLPQGGGVTSSASGYPTYVTGGYVETGIYSASFALTGARSTLTEIYDVWSNTAERTQTGYLQFFTGSISPKDLVGSSINPNLEYNTKITNLKSEYSQKENARFRIHVRSKDWSPTIYSKATSGVATEIVEDTYYKVVRLIDNFETISYGTGSLYETRMSYDVSGSYFDLDMGLLEAGYGYGIRFTYYVNGAYHEQPEVFKFRVEK